jgi:hypothetical protein
MKSLLAILLISTAVCAGTPSSQAGQVPPAPATRSGAAAPAPSSPPAPRARTPVLAQGAILSSAPGFVRPSASDPGLVTFSLAERTLGSLRRSLTLLPSDPADDVKRMLEHPTVDTPWRFEVSGQVFDYQGRAFLLPLAIVALRNPPAPPYLARETPPGMEWNPAEEVDAGAESADSAAATMDARGVSAAAALAPPLVPAGPTRQGPGTLPAHEQAFAAMAGTDDSIAEELERRLARGLKEAPASKGPEPAVDRTLVLSSGVRLQDRRAAIARDPLTGTWRAILEAGAKHGADIAMELLPCRELERVERAVKAAPIGTPWLLSGEVVASGTQNYLLLSRAREMPRDRWLFR